MSTYQRVQRRRKPPHRRLFGERLEDRAMLAVLFSHDADDPVRAIAPTQGDYDDFGLDWLGGSEPFDDAAWTATSGASNAVGYDRGSGAYDSLLGLDVESAMYNASPTVFVRAEFEVTDPLPVNLLTLRLRYDDGFIAWLNGIEVARANAGGAYPTWSATATATHQASTTEFDVFDLTNRASALHAGTNVLAIRALNDSLAGDDALVQFTLTGESRTGPPLARDDAASTTENQAVTIDVLANDDEGFAPIAPGTVAIATPPAHGTALANADGTITYTPATTFNGLDTFSYTVRDNTVTGAPFTQTLVASNAAVKALVPANDNLGATWRGGNEPFNDSLWMAGTFGVGYDTNTANVDYNPMIGLNVGATLQNVNTTVYMRSTFTIANPADVTALTLRMRYDDGFAAFINGVRVASAYAPASLSFNSTTADGSNGDDNAIVFQTFNVSSFISALRTGVNVLAIHGLNLTAGSSDLLMQPELTATVHAQGRISNAATVTVNVTGVDFTPIARDDTATTTENQAVTVDVFANDIEPDGQDMTAVLGTPPAHGTLALAADGTFTYTPAAGFVGVDTFTYRASDGVNLSEPATVSITVRDVEALAAGLTGYWPFDGSGDDRSGNARDLSLYGGVGFAPGLFGQALDMNHNTSQYAARPVSDAIFNFGAPTRSTLVDLNATWAYESSGTDLGTAWRESGFNDSAWARHTAPFTTVGIPTGSVLSFSGAGATLDGPFAPYTLGWEFNVTTPITVASVGWFDSGAGLSASHPVGIFTNSGTLLASATVTPSDPLASSVSPQPGAGFRYHALASPLALGIGTYRIGGLNPAGSSDRDYDFVQSVTTAPQVSFVHSYYTPSSVLSFPNTFGDREKGYFGVNFQLAGGAPVLNAGPSTYYFRTTFPHAPADGALELSLESLVDDGAVFYLNGVEVYRQNMPEGAVGYSTLAATAIGTASLGGTVTIPAASLAPGNNVLAVEVHQATVADADAAFNARLKATVARPNFTIQEWVNFDTTSGEQVLIEKFDGGGGPGWTFTKLDNNALRIAGINVADTPALTIPTNHWHQFLIRKDGPQLDVYFNGALVRSSAGAGGEVSDASRPLLIGKRNDGDGRNFAVDGRIDEVAIWNRALSDAEIAALYNNGAGITLHLCASCADAYSVDEDGTLTVDLATGILANDGAQAGETLSASVAVLPGHGTLALAADGSFTYTPAPNYFGSDAFTYQILSNQRDPRNASVAITINSVPDAPIAADDAYTTGEGQTLITTSVTYSATILASNPVAYWRLDDTSAAVGGVIDAAADLAPPQSGPQNGTFIGFNPANLGLLGPRPTDTVGEQPLLGFEADNRAPTFQGDADGGNDVLLIPDTAPLNFATNRRFTLEAWVNGATTQEGGAPIISRGYGTNEQFTIDLVSNQYRFYVRDAASAPTILQSSVGLNNTWQHIVATFDQSQGIMRLYVNAVEVATTSPPATLNNPAHDVSIGSRQSGPGASYDHNFGGRIDEVAIYDRALTAAELQAHYYAALVTVTNATSAGILGNDTESDGQTMTAVLATPPAHGVLDLGEDGAFRYTPNVAFVGNDSFTYRASDGVNESALATVTITVNHVAPTATPDAYDVGEDSTLTVPMITGVLANDSDTQNHPLTASVALQTTHGTLALNLNGSFTYTPAPNYSGLDSFTYQVSDGTLQSATATVSILVHPENDAPVAVKDVYRTSAGQLLNISATPSPVATALIPTGSVWKYRDNITNGAAYPVDPQGDLWTENDYDAAAWPAAPAILGYGVMDFGPIATVIGYGGNASDKYRTVLFRRAFNLANANRVTSLAFDALIDDGAAVYINGREVLRYNLPGTLGDGALRTDSLAPTFGNEASYLTLAVDLASFPGLLVDGANTIAVEVHQTQPDSSDVGFDLAMTAAVLPQAGVLANDTDADNDVLTASLVAGPYRGALAFRPDGTLTYTPAAGFSGVDQLTYRASDGTAASNLTLITINVGAANEPPAAVDDRYIIWAGRALSRTGIGGVLANDFDPNGDALSATVLSSPAHGALGLAADGGFTYIPQAGFAGTDSFTYRARDGSTAFGVATATIDVLQLRDPINAIPRAMDDSYNIASAAGQSVAAPGVLANDTDAEENALSAVIDKSPWHGALSLTSDGGFVYTPRVGFTGQDTFTYRATDGNTFSPPAVVTLNVGAALVPAAPLGGPFVGSTDTPQSTSWLSNDGDLDGDGLFTRADLAILLHTFGADTNRIDATSRMTASNAIAAADVNHDNRVDLLDMIAIRNALANANAVAPASAATIVRRVVEVPRPTFRATVIASRRAPARWSLTASAIDQALSEADRAACSLAAARRRQSPRTTVLAVR